MSQLPGFKKIRFSEITFDKTFDESMKLLNSNSEDQNAYEWGFQKITSSQSNSIEDVQQETKLEIIHDGLNGNVGMYLHVDSSVFEHGSNLQVKMDRNYYIGGIQSVNEFSIDSFPITFSQQYSDNLFGLKQSSSVFSQGRISGNHVEDYNKLYRIVYGEGAHYITTDDPNTNQILKCTPKITYDPSENITSATYTSKDITFSRMVGSNSFEDILKQLNHQGTEDQYQLSEHANILFGENYQVSKEKIDDRIPLTTINESVSIGGNTLEKYYQDPNSINYVLIQNYLIAVGTITGGVVVATETIPMWDSHPLFKRLEDTDPDHYEQLSGIMMDFNETSSSYEIVAPETCITFIISNYYGKMDISNCTITNWDQDNIWFLNCNNGTLIISSEQANTLGDKIVNGRLFNESGIQVEVKTV